MSAFLSMLYIRKHCICILMSVCFLSMLAKSLWVFFNFLIWMTRPIFASSESPSNVCLMATNFGAIRQGSWLITALVGNGSTKDESSLDLTSIAAFENGGFNLNFHVANGWNRHSKTQKFGHRGRFIYLRAIGHEAKGRLLTSGDVFCEFCRRYINKDYLFIY